MQQRDDMDWRLAAVKYTAAHRACEEAKQYLEEAKQELVDLTEEDASGFGVEVKFTERRGTVDYKKIFDFIKPEIDVEQFRKKPSSVVSININQE